MLTTFDSGFLAMTMFFWREKCKYFAKGMPRIFHIFSLECWQAVSDSIYQLLEATSNEFSLKRTLMDGYPENFGERIRQNQKLREQ
jgi:hypothetical protein